VAQLIIIFLTFLAVSGLVVLVALLVAGRNRRLEARVEELTGTDKPRTRSIPAGQFTRSTLPRLVAPLMPTNDAERTLLKIRLLHAGYYSPIALPIYLSLKMLLLVVPPTVLFTGLLLKLMPVPHALLAVAGAFGVGLVAPGLWLDFRKRRRQHQLRIALPDALDIIIICLEGGLSLPGAFERVVRELRLAHPRLAAEMAIAQRHMQLGRSTGEALREFGDRCDLEEMRGLASIVTQSERFGASLVKSLRVHAESLRVKRLQYAEERAQKAVVKMLFPTILFIFPAIFVVMVGPAVIIIREVFSRMKW
jgi:tight adherence protein C